MRHLTFDSMPALAAATRFYTTHKLGPKQELTPDGFLLCRDVPIARTGTMYYGPRELPEVPKGANDFLTVTRDESEVFRPDFVASFNGKPVTDNHPPEAVTPANWKRYAVGTVTHPRRGTGDLEDYIVADLLITDARAIENVRAGKREVSCGYDAKYEVIEPGFARQHSMVGNHVALVDAARCGPSCSIRDHQPQGEDMHTRDHAAVDQRKRPVVDAIVTALKAVGIVKDENKAAVEAATSTALDSALPSGERDEHIHIHPGGQTVDAEARSQIAALDAKMTAGFDELKRLLSKDATEEEEEEEERKRREMETQDAAAAEFVRTMMDEVPTGTTEATIRATKDSSLLAESFQQTVSGAEILAPGIALPSFDKAAEPKATFDSMCKLRRRALDHASANPALKAIVETANGGKKFVVDQLSCAQVRGLFHASVGAVKASKAASTHDRGGAQDRKPVGGVASLAELNKKNRERYKV